METSLDQNRRRQSVTRRAAGSGPAEPHLSRITAVPGAKLASGKTEPLVDLSQHVAGAVLVLQSQEEERCSRV